MRSIVLLALAIAFGLNLNAQKQNTPQWYLNKNRIDYEKHFINPNSIELIRVNKEAAYGEIHITTKPNVTFSTLHSVITNRTDLKLPTDNILVRINGTSIQDTSGIRIDDTFFVYIETESLTNVTYLNKKFNDLLIVDITLETTEKKPKILIRGNPDLMIDELRRSTREAE